MSRQEQVYAGPVLVDGEQFYAEVWRQDDTAVVFSRPDNSVRLTLRNIDLGLSESNQIVVTGLADNNGTLPVVVEAVAAEQVLGNIVGAHVEWPTEPAWPGATVTWTQYRVTVALVGQDPRVYPGATVRAYPREAYIVLPDDGGEVHVALPARMGCCGQRR